MTVMPQPLNPSFLSSAAYAADVSLDYRVKPDNDGYDDAVATGPSFQRKACP